MRYCGIDVSATAANQQLCTLHERRGSEGEPIELVATFYVPGTVEAVARTVLGFGGEGVAAVVRRRLPLYPVPSANQALAAWERWIGRRLRPVHGARAAGPVPAGMLATGGGSWVGDPRAGVIVLPVEELLARYDPLPPPARAPLDSAWIQAESRRPRLPRAALRPAVPGLT